MGHGAWSMEHGKKAVLMIPYFCLFPFVFCLSPSYIAPSHSLKRRRQNAVNLSLPVGHTETFHREKFFSKPVPEDDKIQNPKSCITVPSDFNKFCL